MDVAGDARPSLADLNAAGIPQTREPRQDDIRGALLGGPNGAADSSSNELGLATQSLVGAGGGSASQFLHNNPEEDDDYDDDDDDDDDGEDGGACADDDDDT